MMTVIVLALVLAALLNAEGMYKGAVNRDAGVGRDVAVALTGPLRDVSHALYLDRPRRWVKEAIGREDDDRIDSAIAAPPPVPSPRPPATPPPGPTPDPTPKPTPDRTPTPKPTPDPGAAEPDRGATKPTAPPPAAPPKRAFGPERPLRIWVAGDSLGQVPGLAIVRRTGGNRALVAVGDEVRTRIGTGLGRPDVYNWFDQIAAALRDYRPDVVVLALGGNDFHSYMSGLPEGTTVGRFLSASWTREYRRRVGILLDTITRLGAAVVWIGLPKPSSPNMRPRFAALNELIRAEIAERPETSFLDTFVLLAGKGGRYAEYLPDASGKLEKVRADDGLHLAPAGGDRVASALVGLLGERYDIESWRTRKR